MIIGRVYAAQLERRRNPGADSNDAFYVKVAEALARSDIDEWLQSLRTINRSNGNHAVVIHRRLLDFLGTLTGMNNRSFASKYLHFHHPGLFFIYDARVRSAARSLVKLPVAGPHHHGWTSTRNMPPSADSVSHLPNEFEGSWAAPRRRATSTRSCFIYMSGTAAWQRLTDDLFRPPVEAAQSLLTPSGCGSHKVPIESQTFWPAALGGPVHEELQFRKGDSHAL
jgi:hypothetical protein